MIVPKNALVGHVVRHNSMWVDTSYDYDILESENIVMNTLLDMGL